LQKQRKEQAHLNKKKELKIDEEMGEEGMKNHIVIPSKYQ